MSVEPSEFSTEEWTRWQGHVINGVFPLGRCLGSSDHSGVFLTKAAQRGLAEVAIKLVPANRALAELLLPRWKRAGALVHPHLLRIFEWGGCQLEGLPYLYVVMEYADQTLAQVLLHRALTDEEVREMLPPVLDALAFLHGRNLVHGALKPANILVVGDQLKLASDTVRRVGDEDETSSHAVTASAEGWQRGGSSAADVRALGISLFEALTRRASPRLGDPREAVVLPSDFSPAFRDIVARCLTPCAQDRPSVTDLLGRTDRPTAEASPVPVPPAPLVVAESTAADTAPSRPVPPQAAAAEKLCTPAAVRFPVPRLTTMLWAVLVLALVWTGARLISGRHAPVPPAPAVQSPAGSPLPATELASPRVTAAGVPVSAPSTIRPLRSAAASTFSALHEVTPDVSPGARRTIHGHINVWVRVTVDQNGSVSDAVADRQGPSKYFERIAIEAARKWTFPPADSPSRRLMQIRFDFSRDGTTERTVLVH